MKAEKLVFVETINREHILINLTDEADVIITPADDWYKAVLTREDCLKLFGLLALWVSEYAQRSPENMAWLTKTMQETQTEHDAVELRMRKAGEA